LLVLRRDPHTLGYHRSRWSLSLLAQECEWLQVGGPSTLSRLLKRLGISYKRGREYVHSPDPHYEAKRQLIEQARQQAHDDPQRIVLVYVDQLSYFRQPSVAQAYEARGHAQALARRSHRSNTYFRVMAGLDALTGQVIYRQRSRTSRWVVADFWRLLRCVYPEAETIYAVIDNWPVHFHPDALAPLQPQHFSWEPRVPDNWPTEPTKAVDDNLPIQLLCLPTYASWLNPIEKLWRWLKQDVLHLHRYSDDWPALRGQVAAFLDQFEDGSDALLRYVGLLPN
jgi:transposase